MTPRSSTRSFADFQISLPLKEALQKLGYEVPTPIQTGAIPAGLAGRDILGCAQTGTGKTLAYVIPVLERLLADSHQRALILVPTRELGQQVLEVVERFRALLKLDPPVLLIGGIPMYKQLRALKQGSRILVATPGRLVDHIKHGGVTLRNVKTLILDEADRMLDIGFAPQLNEILRVLPADRQTMLFTATVVGPIKKLAETYLRSPERVTVGHAHRPQASVERQTLLVEQKAKNDKLLDVLKNREGSILIFTRTQSRADRLCQFMESYGFEVARLHGGRTQSQRTRAIEGFRKGEFRILIATDIAARGLDIAHVGFVVNFDLPQAPEDYIHRVGRTGRAGKTGEALSFVTPEDRNTWKAIQRMTGETGGPVFPAPTGRSAREGGDRRGDGGGRGGSGGGPRGGGGGRSAGGRGEPGARGESGARGGKTAGGRGLQKKGRPCPPRFEKRPDKPKPVTSGPSKRR